MKHLKKYLFGSIACAAAVTGVQAADHGDTPALSTLGRHDAKITDWHAFHKADGTFVMSTCTNPTIPVGASYQFPADLTVRMHIDRDSAVDFSNAEITSKFGGDIVDPGGISAEVTLEFSFDENNQPVLHAEGLDPGQIAQLQVFSGLRDDPFINGLRNGRNSACIVVQGPLAVFAGGSQTLLTWTTSKVPDINGPISEHSGRALQSQKPANDAMNTMRPRDHHSVLGLRPDVAIHNLSEPAGFPNGRLLTDDVIDQTMDPPFANPTAQAPTENDKPFLASFPYLAEPW